MIPSRIEMIILGIFLKFGGKELRIKIAWINLGKKDFDSALRAVGIFGNEQVVDWMFAFFFFFF